MTDLETILRQVEFKDPPAALRERIVRDARRRLGSRRSGGWTGAALAIAIVSLVALESSSATRRPEREVRESVSRPVATATAKPSMPRRQALRILSIAPYLSTVRPVRRLSPAIP